MKPLTILILGSLSLSAGGVAMLYMNDHNIFNLEVWSFAVKGFLTIPEFMINEAIHGDNPDLIRGLMISLGGMTMAMIFGMVAGAASVMKSLRGKGRKSPAVKPEKEKKETRRDRKASRNSSSVDKEGRDGLGGKLKTLVAKMKAKGKSNKMTFEDAEADLEGEEKPKKVKLVDRLKEKFSEMAGKKKTLVIKSGPDQETVVQIQDDGEFVGDLKHWYRSIKSVSQGDPEKVREARELQARASKRARGRVTEEDAMNGEFMLRMMDAWASKKEASGADYSVPIIMSGMEDATETRDTFSRAIHEVMTEGVGADDDVDDFALDDVDDEDDDFIIQDVDDDLGPEDVSGFDISEEVEEVGFDGSDEILSDEEGSVDDVVQDVSEGNELEGDLKSITAARFIIQFEEKASEVASFHDQWDDELAEASDRNAYVEEMFSALEIALRDEVEQISELSAFDADGDAPEIEWLHENMNSLDQKKETLMSPIESSSEPEDTLNDDLEAEFAIGSEVSSDESENDGVTDFDDEIDTLVSADEAQEDTEDHSMEIEDKSLTDDEEGTDSLAKAVENEIDNFDEGGRNDADETPSMDKEEEEPHEPRNVSLAELDEIEKCDELIYNWALVAKSAGAAEAKISHSVIAKDGLRRRVVGITHLVAAWRGQEKDDSRRLNILLRYVPEGEWHLEADDYRINGIKMVDTRGDFVQVSSEMIGQPEIESGVLLVHFYGPGASKDILVEKDNFIVTTSTLSVDKVREKMVE